MKNGIFRGRVEQGSAYDGLCHLKYYNGATSAVNLLINMDIINKSRHNSKGKRLNFNIEVSFYFIIANYWLQICLFWLIVLDLHNTIISLLLSYHLSYSCLKLVY